MSLAYRLWPEVGSLSCRDHELGAEERPRAVAAEPLIVTRGVCSTDHGQEPGAQALQLLQGCQVLKGHDGGLDRAGLAEQCEALGRTSQGVEDQDD